MTNPDYTLIAALLDRSGSMSVAKPATEDGWRELIGEQRQESGRCEVTLAQFDTEYEVLYPATDIGAVPEFVVEPRGRTALLDSAGRFVTEVGQRLAELPEAERPGKVICVIMTDGMENASHEWTWEQVSRLITQQREVYGWEFIFLGANIDAEEVGARMGMERDKAMTFAADSYVGNRRAYVAVSAKISDARAGRSSGFTPAERAASMGDGQR